MTDRNFFDIEAAKKVMASKYDADELVDILDIDNEELLDRFEDRLEAYLRKDEGHDELPDEDE